MTNRLDRVASETLGALQREAIADPTGVRAILEQAIASKIVLRAGIDRRNDPRAATILQVDENTMLLSAVGVGEFGARQLFFTFEIDSVRYFFACSSLAEGLGRTLRATVPSSIYRAERRDLARLTTSKRADLFVQGGPEHARLSAHIADESLHGLCLTVPGEIAASLPLEFELRIGPDAERRFGRVRHRTPESSRRGWTRVGLSVSSVPTGKLVRVDRRDRILDRYTIRDAISLTSTGIGKLIHRAGISSQRAAKVNLVEYENDRGQVIRAIENCYGDLTDCTAVVIPPAWGRTKETLLPLAITLVETFQSIGKPIRVIRFDGTNRRGESYIDPDCRRSGDEYLRFTFSQAARDISATVSYLRQNKEATPRAIILVTFSLAAVEARHALAADERVNGWVSVVGMADLQSALRTISGGIDYGHGLIQGIRFGRHELVGVVADMDHTGLDAIRNGMGFLEDVRRDMACIDMPITWIHGRYDAWMDLDRVVETMSCGRTDNRRIIEVPTGHQLRNGQNALATFQLIAEEVTEMALGHRRRGVIPRWSRIAEARAGELSRLPSPQEDIRGFWENYLLGRSRVLGMELLAATAAYRNFMEMQVRLLNLTARDRVADLGSGIGEFAVALRQRLGPKNLEVIEVDFIRSALLRARSRGEQGSASREVMTRHCLADLDLGRGQGVPFANRSLSAAIASLVISYVSRPERFLSEIYRVLKPGGRIVISSMVRDADGMMLFHDGVIEYATTESRASLGQDVVESFDELVRDFLNDGSRLLELEERGRFRFWDDSELCVAVASAGFVEVQSRQGFGEPPQAVIVSARRP